MASEYDYETTFTFRKPKDFWVHLNKQMVIKDRDTLNGDGLYHLILFSSLPQDFNDCIDSNGCLKQSATGMTIIDSGQTDQTFHLGVEWIDDGENGFNLFLDEWRDNNDSTSEKVNVEIRIDEGIEFYGKPEDNKVIYDSNFIIDHYPEESKDRSLYKKLLEYACETYPDNPSPLLLCPAQSF